MSILNLRPSRTERNEPILSQEARPYAPRPKPAPPGPHQLGNITLQALDQITEKCAAEYDRAADQLEEAARERADGLRECARRMRSTGFLASERVGNFVRVMLQSADVSMLTQQTIAQCDEPRPEPQAQPETAAPNDAATTNHLAKVEAAVTDVMSNPGGAAVAPSAGEEALRDALREV